MQAAAETEEERAGPHSELHAGEAPGASWSWVQRVEGAGAQSGARRSEGPESREQGAGGQVSAVQTLCWGGRGERETESPGLGKEQPAAMAVRLGT